MLTKFLILPEKEEDNFFTMLPLITSLQSEYKDCEINLMHSFDLSYQFQNLFPHIRFWNFNEEQLGPTLSIKLAEQMVEIFNVDFLINYRKDIGALQLGKAFNAKKRIGKKGFINNLFLTDSYELSPSSEKRSYNYLSLWSQFLKKDLICDSLKFSYDEGLNPDINDCSKEMKDNGEEDSLPFVFFPLLFDSENAETMNLVIELMNQMNDVRKIYWFPGENLFTEEFKNAPIENFIDASEVGPENLFHYILRCQGVISNIPWLSSMSSFMQVENIFIKGSYGLFPETDLLKVSPMYLDRLDNDCIEFTLGKEKRIPAKSELFEIVLNHLRL